MSVKEMLEFVQTKAIEFNWYDIQDPRPSSKTLEFHLKRAVDYAIKWKDKDFTSSGPSVPINTVMFSPANGSQMASSTASACPGAVPVTSWLPATAASVQDRSRIQCDA